MQRLNPDKQLQVLESRRLCKHAYHGAVHIGIGHARLSSVASMTQRQHAFQGRDSWAICDICQLQRCYNYWCNLWTWCQAQLKAVMSLNVRV